MMKFKRLCLSLCVALLAISAQAEQLPLVSEADNRVQLFNYNPDDVYLISTQVGYASLIQLEQGEYLDDESVLGMGDAESWSVAVRSNNIVFKPINHQPDTNIVLVTNKRTYAFQLSTGRGKPTYIARFRYPEEPSTQKKEVENNLTADALKQVGIDSLGRGLFIEAKYNTQYKYRGEPMLKPTAVWSDGRFTYLKFAHAGDLPSVYRVMPDHSEMLVNSHIEGDTLVIQEVSQLYRLRFGRAVGDVANLDVKIPTFNTDGTSDSRLIRTEQ